MKIEPEKYYRTRDGRKARIYAIACGGNYPIHGAVCDAKNVAWSLATWTNEGGFFAAGGRESGFDLIAEWREPGKVKGWVNVYESHLSCPYSTREQADALAGPDRTACVYVRGVEGEVPTDMENACK